jgi:sugar lactone lactonase YvrE
MSNVHVLTNGFVFGEQPRWHDDRLWLSDWGTQEVIAVDMDGNSEVMLKGESFPLCVDWLPDGRLVVVSASEGLLLRQEPDGSLVTYGDLASVSDPPAANELVVDGRGYAYVNGGGFDLMAGEDFAPGIVALVRPEGRARQVAEGLAFPNGMLIMPDDRALVVAESYARRLSAFDIEADGSLSHRRVWAELGDGVPDGICADAEDAIWYADVPQALHTRARRRRGAANRGTGPWLLRVCPRRPGRRDPLHGRPGVERARRHVPDSAHGPGADNAGARTRSRSAVGAHACHLTRDYAVTVTISMHSGSPLGGGVVSGASPGRTGFSARQGLNDE